VLGVATVGDTVGELAALDGGPRTATARVTEPTVADYLPRDIVEPSLAAAPSAAYRLMRLMAARLRQTDRLVGELSISGDMGGSGRPPSPPASAINDMGGSGRPPSPPASATSA
jgi:CRP-like cAMP-binding protein